MSTRRRAACWCLSLHPLLGELCGELAGQPDVGQLGADAGWRDQGWKLKG